MILLLHIYGYCFIYLFIFNNRVKILHKQFIYIKTNVWKSSGDPQLSLITQWGPDPNFGNHWSKLGAGNPDPRGQLCV